MNKIEELQKALKFADEREMVYECVDVLRDTLPVIVEAVEALEKLTEVCGYPTSYVHVGTVDEAKHVLAKLKGEA